MKKSASIIVDYPLLQKKGDESLESKLQSLIDSGVKRLLVKSLFISRGFEYRGMKARFSAFSSSFEKIIFKRPLLAGERQVYDFAKKLISHSYFDLSRKTLLVGHGLPFSKNSEYFALERKLHKLGAKNVRILLLKGRGGLKEFIKRIEKSGKRNEWSKLDLIPLFIKAGHHVKKDIFGSDSSEERSLCQLLEENGFSVNKKITALSEKEWLMEDYK